jgi:hypothetical protein
MRRLKSDIPAGATERLLRKAKRRGIITELRMMECVLNGKVVGRRGYTPEGKLVIETPLENGRAHGSAIQWNEDGKLELVEPYSEGKVHGTARQYSRGGRVVGTYKLVHGTGLDVWRVEFGGRVYVSEIHSLRDGLPDGPELWFNFGARVPTLWHERFWRRGELHGIERMWNSRGNLGRGFPKFWILGQKVSRRRYAQLAKTDKSLRPVREKDNLAGRQFSSEIQQIVTRR